MNTEIEEFKTEILETLERAEQALMSFDKLSDGENSHGLYDEVFRAYHNIKGAAGMMEWNELQHHVHQLENVLMQHKETASIPKNLISWFLKGNDATRAIMAQEAWSFDYNLPESTSQEVVVVASEDLPEEFYAEVREGIERISDALLKFEKGEGSKDLLDSIYRDVHSIKGATQLFDLHQAAHLSHIMENTLERLRGAGYAVDTAATGTLLMSLDLLMQAVKLPLDESMITEVGFMVSLLEDLGPSAQIEEVVAQPAPVLKPSVEKVEKNPESSDKSDSTIRVQVSLLDRLMTLMGEMVLVRNQVLQYSSKSDDLEFLNLSQKLDVVTSELQEETMKTRMQPIGNVLSKFQRVVRDLSTTLGKNINIQLSGTETELDKSLIESVKDPLTHIVRNACDHGIETPEDRISKGKKATGTISINAFHEGGQVIIDIMDDGRGLSREKLLAKALEKGIISKEKAQTMSERDVQALIFAPGFSTAEKVTNVSGRGVGMDVVKSNIEKIGGFVDISSIEGKGTKITLKIPLTLAIVPAMIIRSGEDRYAIPQVKLVELVRAEGHQIEYVQGKPVYRLRGNILPLLSLTEVLGVEIKEATLNEATYIVVLSSENHQFGMVVDEVLDTADIVVKPLPKFLKSLNLYSGATVLGDGGVAFILDIVGISHKHLGSIHEELDLLQEQLLDFSTTSHETREFVLVYSGSKTKFAIPLHQVSRMEEIKASTIEESGKRKVIRYRGGIMEIVSLRKILGYEPKTEERDIVQVIVVRQEDQFLGLEVDEIIDVLTTNDPLDESIRDHQVFCGNLITKNEVMVVIDVDKVFELISHKISADGPVNAMGLSKSNGMKFLIVEDTESVRLRISSLLAAAGYEVHTANDGIEGLKRIAERNFDFDLIISDIEMPRMNGYEFATKVRTYPRLSNTPLIAFTTKNTEGDIMLAKKSGFDSFLEKSKSKLLVSLVGEFMKNKVRKIA